MLKFNEPGTNVEPGYFFYMKYNVVPVAGDLILDVNWDGTNVNQLVMPYAVSFPEPYRGDAGRIEYWRVAVQTIARDQDIFYQGLMKRNVKRSVSTQ
jgi:hypothetical protein